MNHVDPSVCFIRGKKKKKGGKGGEREAGREGEGLKFRSPAWYIFPL